MSLRLAYTKFRSSSSCGTYFGLAQTVLQRPRLARCDASIQPARRINNKIPISYLCTVMTDKPTEYKWVDGAERIEGYTKGGFHPIHIGDILHHGRYRIVDKLGQGGWSTVWLAHDSRQKEYVALKVGIADSLPQEVQVLRALGKRRESSSPVAAGGYAAIPHLLDDFRVEGPNGSHPCYTTTPALGSLREVSFSRLFPLDVSRAFAYELALAVAYLHSQGFVHGDIHLRNVLVKPTPGLNELSLEQFRETYGKPDSYPVERTDGGNVIPPGVPSHVVVPLSLGTKHAQEYTLQDAHLLLSDFGESFAPAREVRLGQDCHTPNDFRPPDAHLYPSVPLSFSADIWSLGTAVWDIVGMKQLFGSSFHGQDEVIAQAIESLGPLPAGWFEKWEHRAEYFNEDGSPVEGREVWPQLPELFEEHVQKYRRKREMGEFGDEETTAFLDLIRGMLKFEPSERLTAEQVLQSDWMVKWARPDYERGLEKKDS